MRRLGAWCSGRPWTRSRARSDEEGRGGSEDIGPEMGGSVRMPPREAQMKRLLLACMFLMLATVAEAEVPPTCLPTLPTSPSAPLFTLDVAADDDHIHLEIWRQPCPDGSGRLAVLIRATPTSTVPYLAGGFFTIVQGGVQIKGRLRINTSTTESFGADLLGPTTLVLTEASGSPTTFTEEDTFVLIWEGLPDVQIEIPAQSPPPPVVHIVMTACNPCKIGDFAELHLHVSNPGPPRPVEVKAGSHFPDGVTTFVFLGRYVEMGIPAGESEILIPGLTLPTGLPFGTYTIEAALLEPDLGTTLSRHSVTAQLVP
jgi:hypothetical protein